MCIYACVCVCVCVCCVRAHPCSKRLARARESMCVRGCADGSTMPACSDGGGGRGGQGSTGAGSGRAKNPPTRLRNSTYEETKRAAVQAAAAGGGAPTCYRCLQPGRCNPRGGEVLCWECLAGQLTRNVRNQLTKARASAPTERLLVGLSGGPRSAALAHLLRLAVSERRERAGRTLHVELAFVDDLEVSVLGNSSMSCMAVIRACMYACMHVFVCMYVCIEVSSATLA